MRGPARLTIDLDALAGNWRTLQRHAGGAECAGVVKADSYGLGLDATAPALWEAGCRTYFVAHVHEGVRLRGLLPSAVIYVLNGLLPGSADAHARERLRPVLGSVEEIEEWRTFLATSGWRGEAALHVDTGINRLGLDLAAAAALAARLREVPLSLVLSHLACAEDAAHPMNALQVAAFREARGHYPGVPASLANSSGIFLPGATFDLVRPGYALHGGNPLPGRPSPTRPVVALEAGVIQVRDVPEGASVGYGASWTAGRPSRIAYIHLGYADGFLRAGSGPDGHSGAVVSVADRRCPVVGRISMDMAAADVTDLPEGTLRRGDAVEVIGPTLSIEEVAERAGTIGYELLTDLGRRYERRVLGCGTASPSHSAAGFRSA